MSILSRRLICDIHCPGGTEKNTISKLEKNEEKLCNAKLDIWFDHIPCSKLRI